MYAYDLIYHMRFKVWFEATVDDWEPEDPSQYDPPDEAEMQQIMQTPISCALGPPSLHGDIYRLQFPLGTTIDYLVRFGAKIGNNAPPGSLKAACDRLLQARNAVKLHQTLETILRSGLAYQVQRQVRKQP